MIFRIDSSISMPPEADSLREHQLRLVGFVELDIRQRHVQALRSLPLDLQIVFELYHLEGLTAGELAAMHGISEPGMYGRLRKARLRTIAACERLAETPALRRSTVDRLDDWAAELRARLGVAPGAPDAG